MIRYYFTQLLLAHDHPSFCGTKPRPMKEGKKLYKIRSRDFRHMYPQHIRNFQLSSSQTRVKLENAGLPPMRAAVKLQFPDFLLSERRKTGKSSLPPMRAAVKQQFPAFLLSERRKTGKSSLPPTQAAAKLCEHPIKVARPYDFQLT